jgi:hypothetical protein
MSKQYPFDDVTPRGPEELITLDTIKNQIPKEMEKVKLEQPDVKGVDATKQVIKFVATGYDVTTNALSDDGKISVMEALGIGASLAPQALGTFKALPEVPKELVFDKLSDADVAELVSAFDEIKNLKGDVNEAIQELLPIINDLKDWGLKYFGKDA